MTSKTDPKPIKNFFKTVLRAGHEKKGDDFLKRSGKDENTGNKNKQLFENKQHQTHNFRKLSINLRYDSSKKTSSGLLRGDSPV